MEVPPATYLLEHRTQSLEQRLPFEQVVIGEQHHTVSALLAGVADLLCQEIGLIQKGIRPEAHKELGAPPKRHRLTGQVAGQAAVSGIVHDNPLVQQALLQPKPPVLIRGQIGPVRPGQERSRKRQIPLEPPELTADMPEKPTELLTAPVIPSLRDGRIILRGKGRESGLRLKPGDAPLSVARYCSVSRGP